MSSNNSNEYKKRALGFAAVSEALAYCIAGYFLGKYLDDNFVTFPWLTAALVLIGMVAGFYKMYRIVMKDDEKGSSK